MFYQSNQLLSENQIIGLIGELLFLKELMTKISIISAISSWSGPDPTHKDFSYDNKRYEIKSIHNYKNTVLISSIEQLDSEVDGHLVIYEFEKMSPNYDGITLNKIIFNISRMINSESINDLFVDKLRKVGYAYDDIYDTYVYEQKNKSSYNVNCDFPRLKRESLHEGIGKVKYEILISQIQKFLEEWLCLKLLTNLRRNLLMKLE